MKNPTFLSSLWTWITHLPIQDPIERRMAVMLQMMLAGFSLIILIAMGVVLFLPGLSPEEKFNNVLSNFRGLLIFAIPLIFLRRGSFHWAVWIVIALFIINPAYNILVDGLLASSSRTLFQLTLAMILAGLVAGRRTLIVTYLLSAGLVAAGGWLEPGGGRASIVTVTNFIFLTGVICLFLDQFSGALRGALKATQEREAQLQTEIQERLRAEAQTRQLNEALEQRVAERTRALEFANQELEAFSYSVSHDLRAPLRGIGGFASLLQEEYAPQLDATGQHYLLRIRESAQRMNQLINDLLAFSRLSRQELHKQPVQPASLLQEVLKDLQQELDGRNVALTLASDLPPCEADSALLRQVFANLLDNALKYSRSRSQTQIEINWLNQGSVVYFVRDNGVGFDMKYADKLFGVFQRLHRADEFEGTGVGLATVQRIIQRHGGRIWAEAEVDKGATFYFTLE